MRAEIVCGVATARIQGPQEQLVDEPFRRLLDVGNGQPRQHVPEKLTQQLLAGNAQQLQGAVVGVGDPPVGGEGKQSVPQPFDRCDGHMAGPGVNDRADQVSACPRVVGLWYAAPQFDRAVPLAAVPAIEYAQAPYGDPAFVGCLPGSGPEGSEIAGVRAGSKR